MTSSQYKSHEQNHAVSRLNMIGMWIAIVACIIVLLGMSSTPSTLESNLTRRQITSLPGWPSDFSKDFKLYAGPLNLSTSQEKTLYYTFVTSKNNPAKDPVILWLNGGPGVSSLLGFLHEIGPYVLNEDGYTFEANPFSWNNNANVLFLESPAGVGFSHANISNETYSDEITMVDQYEGLQSFFKAFPEYAKNELWLSGESYAGIYIPHLAYYIDDQNQKEGGNKVKLDLQGFMIGNAYTTNETLATAKLDFFKETNLISQEEHEYADQLASDCFASGSFKSRACGKFINYFTEKIAENHVNPYDISQPCFTPLNVTLPCCNLKSATTYLNSKELKAAFGIPEEVTWIASNRVIGGKYIPKIALPRYPDLIAKKYKILIFSGDTDSVVPYIDSIRWIESLKRPVIRETGFWYLSNGKLGGNLTEYDGLTFATIKGAGHMAPELKREENLWLIHRFMTDQTL